MNTKVGNNLINGIKEVIVTRDQMEKKVKELGRKISEDYTGKELVVIGVLKGAVVFFSDLIRRISLPVTTDFISVSSYGDSANSSGNVRLKKDIEIDIRGKDVLVVEDIIDTGLTLKYIKDLLLERNARSVAICSALDKPSRRDKDIGITVQYTGFQIPDEFVVGYGLDYAEKYRNLEDVCVLSPEVYGKN